MSVKEEEKNKSCSSRGLGIAAAALGVGVGAALYYYFSKRPENPSAAGATTSGWISTEPHVVLYHNSSTTSASTSATISEHSTSDTSIDSDSSSEHDHPLHLQPQSHIQRRLKFGSQDSSSSTGYTFDSDDYSDERSSMMTETENSLVDDDHSSSSTSVSSISDDDEMMRFNSSRNSIDSDSDTNMEWDVTASSLDVPFVEPRFRQFGELTVTLLSPRWNRDRPWTLEECSICCEVMLKDQEVLALSCAHRFHQACVMPWLEEQQTCPNCRKAS